MFPSLTMKTNREYHLSISKKLRLKTITLIVAITVSFTQQVLGQLLDNFSDGDFSANPPWSGDVSNFIIENGILRSSGPNMANQQLHLQIASTKMDDAEWNFLVDLDFNPTALNFVRIYLASNQSNLEGALNGYYIQIGQANADFVKLFRQDGSTSVEIFTGLTSLGTGNILIRIKVKRSSTGSWEIFSDPAGGLNFASEGIAVTDYTYTSTSNFGVYCGYSTASRHNLYHFDDFYVGDIIVDAEPPSIQTIDVRSFTEADVLFSEELEEASAEITSNYTVDQNVGVPITAELLPDRKTVHLVFSTSFPNGVTATLTVNGVSDIFANATSSATKDFLFFQPVEANRRDIIITEIFADQSPPVGLPEAEFIELYNRSEYPFNLEGWEFTDGSSTGNLSSTILLPGQYLILSSSSAQTQFSSFGRVMGISPFPSLNNSGDFLMLKDPGGKTIDSVAYSATWYNDSDKEDGGWSLEIIDPDDFCKGPLNWKASQHESGGTPGHQNSVFSNVPDVAGPKLLSVHRSGEAIIDLEFNEVLHKVLPPVEGFIIEPKIEIIGTAFTEGTFTKISLSLSQDLDSAKTYSIKVQDVYDCPGNKIQEAFSNALLRLDQIFPEVQSIKTIGNTELELLFSEKVDRLSAENILNYQVINSGNPGCAVLKPDKKTVRILFSYPFANGVSQILEVKNVSDVAGNAMAAATLGFLFFQAVPTTNKAVIITEIMADPSPPNGLPEVEFIELYNRSNDPFDLKGWKFSDGGTTTTLTNTILLPKEYLIICSSNRTALFSALGKTMGVTSFPSLNNTGEPLVIKDANNLLIDSVNYTDKWYKDDEKKDGGWTLELIDPENICFEAVNWIVSENESGGTPGKQNSVFAEKPDLTGPRLMSAFPVSETVLLLQFDEKLEKGLPASENFNLEPPQEISQVIFSDPNLTSIQLVLTGPLQNGTKYKLIAQNLYDCAGNILQPDFSSAQFALPEAAQNFDVTINEILFNPRPTGVDFVEIYNRSSKFINLKNWKLANLQEGLPANPKVISEKDLLVEPQTYVVLTEDGNVLKGEYLQAKEETFLEMDLPSFPDDEGSVLLLDDKDEIIDGLSYSDRWHSVFLKEDEGVSLEKISTEGPTNDLQNWKSASSASGFATPGYLNSNTRAEGIAGESIHIEPEIFLPAQGQPDFTQIKYNFEKGGYMANVKIIDPHGREVKRLADNELLGTDGFFRWDGDRENGSKASIGSYMVWFEVFDADGEVKTFRKRVVIADKF